MKLKLFIFLFIFVGIFTFYGCKPKVEEVYLTQLTPVVKKNSLIEPDFNPIVFGNVSNVYGKLYANGIFAHPNSLLTFDLNGEYKTLKVEIGLVGTSTCGDGAIFIIILDGNEAYRSQTMHNGDLPIPVEIDITGAQQLTLITDAGPNGSLDCDHTIWGDPLLIKN